MEDSSGFQVSSQFFDGEDGTTSAKLWLSNFTNNRIAFKFHGAALKNYYVCPNNGDIKHRNWYYSISPDKGVVKSRHSLEVVITMKHKSRFQTLPKAFKWFKDPSKKSQKEKLGSLLKNMFVSMAENLESFKESGNTVFDCDFKLVYRPLLQTPARIPKEEDRPVPEEVSSELNPSPLEPKEEMNSILKHKGNGNISYIASYFYYVLIWALGNLKKIQEKIEERQWRCSKYVLMIPAMWGARQIVLNVMFPSMKYLGSG